jgi:predicted RNase H-like nuclease (RuvC/YqgF family)
MSTNTETSVTIQENPKHCYQSQECKEIQNSQRDGIAQATTFSTNKISTTKNLSPSKNKQNRPIVRIDRARIPSIPLSQAFSGNTLEELTKLGVESFNAKEMEENVMQQVNEQLIQHKAQQISEIETNIRTFEKRLEDVQTQIQTLNNDLKLLQNTITQVASSDQQQIQNISQNYNTKVLDF